MSLTSHVTDKSSPIREFFAARFPHTRQLQFASTDEPPFVDVSGLQFTTEAVFPTSPAAVLPLDEIGFPWAAAGTAFDYRVGFELELADPSNSAAFKGWEDMVRLPRGARASDTGWADLVAAVQKIPTPVRAAPGGLNQTDELDLARLCGALALYETYYRMGGLLNPSTGDLPIARVGPNAPLDAILALVDERLPADIAAMVTLLRANAPELGRAGRVVTNPAFARSRDLRGADGDLLADGLLLEIKTVKHARISQAFAWQVLGYLLADTDDVYAIDRVGWYFGRHGVLWTYDAGEFLERLAGGRVDLAESRAQFAELCASLRRPPLTSPETDVPKDDEAWPVLVRNVDRQLPFFPTIRGTGRWHVPMSEVPQLLSLHPADEALQTACGTPTALDRQGKPDHPVVGVPQGQSGEKFCRRCLLYTEQYFARTYEVAAAPELADLPYLPPATGSGKWHVRAGDTRYAVHYEDQGLPVCGSGTALELEATPLRVPDDGRREDLDARLCRRCLKSAVAPTAL